MDYEHTSFMIYALFDVREYKKAYLDLMVHTPGYKEKAFYKMDKGNIEWGEKSCNIFTI